VQQVSSPHCQQLAKWLIWLSLSDEMEPFRSLWRCLGSLSFRRGISMASNKQNRSPQPKTEGEKHQGVGVNPQKYKGNTLSDSGKQDNQSEPKTPPAK
jgi:hypothetical protein